MYECKHWSWEYLDLEQVGDHFGIVSRPYITEENFVASVLSGIIGRFLTGKTSNTHSLLFRP